MKKLLAISLVWGLFSCENTAEQKLEQDEMNKEARDQSTELSPEEKIGEDNKQEMISFKDEVEFAKYCSAQFAKGDSDALRPFVDEKILFSPYAHIDQSTARKITLNEIEAAADDIHYWGIYDGRGDSILLSTPAYLNKYVMEFDVNAEKVKTNTYSGKPKAYGNELHNVQKLYPDAKFVEFYYPPSKEGYMDWKALIYVIELDNERFILRAIVHNQWTT